MRMLNAIERNGSQGEDLKRICNTLVELRSLLFIGMALAEHLLERMLFE